MTAEPVSEDGYPGQRLGLPPEGRGSVASWSARAAALVIDWAVSTLVALALVRPSGEGPLSSELKLWPVLVWGVATWVLTWLTGASFGQRLRRLAVVRLDGQPVGAWRSLIRTGMIALVVPPLVADRDRRGLHDLAVGTVVVRAR